VHAAAVVAHELQSTLGFGRRRGDTARGNAVEPQ